MIPNQPPPGRSEIDPPRAADSLTPEFPPGCRLLFAGGGTGGHLFPGIAVADACRAIQPDCRILFAGSNRPLESRILEQTCYAHQPVDFVSPRYAFRKPLRFLQQWRASSKRTANIFKEFRPDIVVGLGGFASYPLLKQACRTQVPIALLEQNAIPGRVTSLFAGKAAVVCLSYEACRPYLPTKASAVVTGNPIRSEVVEISKASRQIPCPPTLVVCGGSQGSEVINQALLNYAHNAPGKLKQWHVRHQTGQITPDLADQLRLAYRTATASFEIQNFYESPADLYAQATLLVGRGGGTTLAEIAALKIPSVLIPIANAVRNHQFLNAHAHLELNSGELLQETAPTFPEEFSRVLNRSLAKSVQISRVHSPQLPDTPAATRVSAELSRIISRR